GGQRQRMRAACIDRLENRGSAARRCGAPVAGDRRHARAAHGERLREEFAATLPTEEDRALAAEVGEFGKGEETLAVVAVPRNAHAGHADARERLGGPRTRRIGLHLLRPASWGRRTELR